MLVELLALQSVLHIRYSSSLLPFSSSQPESDVYILPVLTRGPDLRLPSTIPLNFTKSISLSLSERGINAIKTSGSPDLLEKIKRETLPMRGRMIHGETASGEFYQQPQDYDIHGRVS